MSHHFLTLFDHKQGTLQQQRQYRGRFAPSPSGPLHFGSLLTALGSYLQARANHGLWFVRIEDIDKPREAPNAVTQILDALVAFGLNWDTDDNTKSELQTGDRHCLVQSNRLQRYETILRALRAENLIYPCHCTRKQIKQLGSAYTGICRDKKLLYDNAAIRIKNPGQTINLIDKHFGDIVSDPVFDQEDYIIKRRDGLFAYQLVVVIDDIDQGITEIVRGADILPLTIRQANLYHLFGITPPSYLHLPLIATKPGFKLSKQNHAKAIDASNPKPELLAALSILGLPVTSAQDSLSVAEIITWAIKHWDTTALPACPEIIIE